MKLITNFKTKTLVVQYDKLPQIFTVIDPLCPLDGWSVIIEKEKNAKVHSKARR